MTSPIDHRFAAAATTPDPYGYSQQLDRIVDKLDTIDGRLRHMEQQSVATEAKADKCVELEKEVDALKVEVQKNSSLRTLVYSAIGGGGGLGAIGIAVAAEWIQLGGG